MLECAFSFMHHGIPWAWPFTHSTDPPVCRAVGTERGTDRRKAPLCSTSHTTLQQCLPKIVLKTWTMAVRALSRRISTQRGAPSDPFTHCSDVVKRGDYDGYLYSLLQGPQLRPAALAIRAFNVETAAIKDSVRGNAMPGKMRMQWWKDSLADIFAGEPPPQPVALALAEVVANQKGGLTRRWFDRVLDARMVDLETMQPETMEEMESYAEYTASSILYLSLELAGIRAGSGAGAGTLSHAAGHVGKAAGICTLLRSLALPPPPAALRTGNVGFSETCVLPSEVMRKFMLRHAVLERGPQDEKEAHALAECVFEVASLAKGHIEAAEEGLASVREEMGGKLPAGAFAALLPGVRVAWYLETLQNCGFNAYDESLRPQSPFKFQLRLGKSLITQKF